MIEDEETPKEEFPVEKDPKKTEEIKEVIEIVGEGTPLAAVPKTSDNAMLRAATMLLPGTAAAGMTVMKNKRKVNR